MPIREAVVLCGGFGTRLGSLTANKPKPMLEVAGLPFIEHVLLRLCGTGVTKVILLAGYLGEQFTARYHQKFIGNIFVEVVVESEPLGTGGAVYAVLNQVDTEFFLLNGDTWTTQSFNYLEKEYFKIKKQIGSIECLALCVEVHNSNRFGKVTFGDHNRLISFDEKSYIHAGFINAGQYVINKDAFSHIKDLRKFSFETEILEKLTKRGSIYGLPCDDKVKFIDMGVPDEFNSADTFMRISALKPAIFWDRDNTLNLDKGYTHRVEDLYWLNGAEKSIKHMHDLGYWNFVITNQSGIARGFYDECAVIEFHRAMQDNLLTIDCSIDYYSFCPHHSDGIIAEHAYTCNCRKPSTGLVDQLMVQFPIDLENSIVIGDKSSDVEVANKLGMSSLQIDPNFNIFKQLVSYLQEIQ